MSSLYNIKHYLSESNVDDLHQGKQILIDELDNLKDNILNKAEIKDDKIVFHDIESLGIDSILLQLNDRLNQEVLDIFNVEAFLRKIYQMLDLSAIDSKEAIENEFETYYRSLNKRIETIAGEERKFSTDDTYDELEGEKSVLTRKQFEREKYELQIELLKLQEWVKKKKKKVVIIFEGRDASGKGSTIKRFTEYLNPKGFRVVALGVPTKEEKKNWFKRYEKEMPKSGEIVFFDRSWHNRSVVEPAMGYCTEKEYKDFMKNVNDWEKSLIDSGIMLIKFWFSITREKQIERFELRRKSPLKYWKFSPNDAKVISKWDLITYYKKQMFQYNSTEENPWIVINTNDKRIGRLNAIRYVLSVIDYEDKNELLCQYYPEVVHILKR